MIIETIRKHIKSCGKTRYRIAKETGVGAEFQFHPLAFKPAEENSIYLKKIVSLAHIHAGR